jgi:hypothetical protein
MKLSKLLLDLSRKFPAPANSTEFDVCEDVGPAAPITENVSHRLLDWIRKGRPRVSPPHKVLQTEIGEEAIMCPSQPSEYGAVILGHISPGERLVRTGSENINQDSLPSGAQLRIAGDCRHERCAYWADSCQLAAAIVDPSDSDGRLPTCPIRQQCRWWLEHGPAACGTCSYVSYLAPGTDTN